MSNEETGQQDYFVEGGISLEQRNQLDTWAIEDHKVDENGKTIRGLSLEQVNAGRLKDGLELLADQTDNRSLEQKSFESNFEAPKSGSDYNLPSFVPHGEEESPLHQEQDQTIRKILINGSFSKEIGESIVNQISRNVRAIDKMNLDEIQLKVQAAKSQLEGVWGGEAAKKLKNVSDFLNHLDKKTPGSKDFLLGSHSIWTDAVLINQLSGHVEGLLKKHGEGFFKS